MNSGELILNSVLCYLNSAKADHNDESLTEIANSFYSYEEIKDAKTEVMNLLGKDVPFRRGHDKKLMDMKDVTDLLHEIASSKTKVRFVSDSYKKMPPIGMEMIAPLLVNLTGEVARINDMLPKILDIKTEVMNTADTMRQLRIDVSDIRGTFEDAVKGLNEASKDISESDLNILKYVRSFRQSFLSDNLLTAP